MASNILTQERLKYLIEYDSVTGIFTWLHDSKNRAYKYGDIAGTLNSNGYLTIGIDGKMYPAHRLAYLYYWGYLPKKDIDHINGNRSDNRLCNIREATRAENLLNQPKHKCNSSGYKGVSWCKHHKKWSARGHNGNRKDIHLGYFDTAEEASVVYEKFSKEKHGAFYYKHGRDDAVIS